MEYENEGEKSEKKHGEKHEKEEIIQDFREQLIYLKKLCSDKK